MFRWKLQLSAQMFDQSCAGLSGREFDAEVAELGHRHAGIAAGIDCRKGREFHGDVERQAVIAAATPDPQAERGDLGGIARAFTPVDIHAGGAIKAPCVDIEFSQQVDN